MPPMRLIHYTGIAPSGGAPQKVSMTKLGQSVQIANTHATDKLEVSFDGGASFFPIPAAREPFKADALFHYFYVRAPGGNNITWYAIVAEG